jgi:abortive infection bacteriophage resistance protein
MKKALTVEEQIERLVKRGMIMDWDLEKTKEILLDIGYYRLGFYWNPFEIDKEHNLAEGTKFSDVVKLYYLDFNLRSILTKYINRIEINLRTKVIYEVSNQYKEDPIWFTNPEYMSDKYISSIDTKLYTDNFKESNQQINLHHKNHRNDKYAPIWKTFEYITFGHLVFAFNSLKDIELQNLISKKHYSLNNLKTFKNFIITIKFIRNICAHGGVLYDINLPKSIYKIPKVKFNNNNNQSLDASLKVIHFITGSISPNRQNDFEKDIDNLFTEHKDNNVLSKIVTDRIGYKYKNT